MTKLSVEAEGSLAATEVLTSSLSAHAHAGTRLGENTREEADVNDAVRNCSSRPGAAESCPRPGLCDLKARS